MENVLVKSSRSFFYVIILANVRFEPKSNAVLNKKDVLYVIRNSSSHPLHEFTSWSLTTQSFIFPKGDLCNIHHNRQRQILATRVQGK